MGGSGISDREYENLVREGIMAVRGGRKKTAHRLLARAAAECPTDTRVWLWLSATTSDPLEQRELLEKAVAADPGNAAAQRGLAILAEQLGNPVPDLPQQAEHVELAEPDRRAGELAEPAMASTFTFECPRCGGRMQHDDDEQALVCEFCGFGHEPAAVEEPSDTPLGAVLPTAQAHAWASSLHEIVCEKCGAHSYEQRGVQSQQCPYCGSNQLVEPLNLQELLDPQAIAPFRVKEKKAVASARAWLNTGLFAPDDLLQQVRNLQMRPAYYPFWTFDGGVELRWSAEVRENYIRSTRQSSEWLRVNGSFVEFFDDVLVPGVAALKTAELAGILPFRLKDVRAFVPEHLAGWQALASDRSLADASVLAREMVLKRLRPRAFSRAAQGKEKRHVRVSAGHWSGVTYKYILLPIWTGTYQYQGEEYHILVNGQTGKVGGEKPKDGIKMAGIWLIAALGGLLLVVFLIWLVLQFGF